MIELVKKVKGFIYKIYRYIKNVITYSNILWHDRDYDYLFIFKMLQYKLKRTRECIIKNDIIVGAEEIGKEILFAEELIDRILNDDYCDNEQIAHDNKWGERSSISSTSLTHPGYFNWNMNRANAITEEDKKLERAEQLAIYDKMEAEKNSDMDKLFAHLRTNIFKWWD